MLGGAHQLSTYRQGKAHAKKLAPTEENLELAENLLFLFRTSLGKSQGDLEEELKTLPSFGHPPKVVQGLAKILHQASEFEKATDEDLAELRREVFDKAAAFWKKTAPRELVAPAAVASAIRPELAGKSTPEVESWLFGDLSSHLRLVAPPAFSAQALIQRYNLEQAQALILQAERLELTLPGQGGAAFRQVMSWLKFCGLLFEVRTLEGATLLVIEGAQSLLENGRSYGVEMANFFPMALTLPGDWNVKAWVRRKGVASLFEFEVTPKSGLVSPYQAQGVFWQNRLAELVARFNEQYGPGLQAKEEQELIALTGNRYLLSDVSLQQGKKRILLEWVRYQSPQALQRLEKLCKEAPKHYHWIIKAKGPAKDDLARRLGSQVHFYATDLTAATFKRILEQA